VIPTPHTACFASVLDRLFPRLSFPFRELWNGAEAHSLGVGRICCGLTQSSYQCLRCGAETVAASHPAETGAARPPTPLAGPSEDHLLEHPAGDAPPSPSAPPSPPEPTTPARSSSATPPSPATPRAPCTRCGEDHIPDAAMHCPGCRWPLNATSKVQYCLGDWCGGPIEPVDGSWHVVWRLLNSANPEQLHTEMPAFAGGRYEREDVEVVRIRGPRPSPRHGLSAAGSSSAHAGLAPDGANHEDETAPSEHAGAAPAHMPSAAAPEGPPDPVALAPAYPPPTGPAHGREYSSDEDGGGPYGTEAGDVNYADAAGAAAGRVTDERLHIAATTYPRGSLDGALPSPPVGLENLPTEVIGATIMPMLGLRRSRELDFYGAMEPQEMATYYYTGGGRPLLVITSSRLASE